MTKQLTNNINQTENDVEVLEDDLQTALSQTIQDYKKHRPSSILDDLVKTATKEFLAGNLLLEAFANAAPTHAQWHQWAVQRYLMGRQFDALLISGAQHAATMNPTLSKAFADNLRDEWGIDADGDRHSDRAHENWRITFYKTLGIDTGTLQNSIPTEGARAYQQMIENLCASEDCLLQAGGLLYLEHSIPVEFKRIQMGRDKTFPDLFVVTENDTPGIIQQKQLACLYIDDHIHHDAQSHYPLLRHALEIYAEDVDAMQRIQAGIDQAMTAKKFFYTSLYTELFSS